MTMTPKEIERITEGFNTLTEDIITYAKKRCEELKVPVDGLPGPLMYAFNEVVTEEIENTCNSKGGPSMALTYIGHQMRVVQHVVGQINDINTEVEKIVHGDVTERNRGDVTERHR